DGGVSRGPSGQARAEAATARAARRSLAAGRAWPTGPPHRGLGGRRWSAIRAAISTAGRYRTRRGVPQHRPGGRRAVLDRESVDQPQAAGGYGVGGGVLRRGGYDPASLRKRSRGERGYGPPKWLPACTWT